MNSRASPNAFTLVELLVVIAIIAIIAALLLPAITSSPKPAPGIPCLNNLRQITLAIHMYVEDWGQDAAGNTNNFTSPFLSWTSYRTLIVPYVSIKHSPSPQDKIFACPKDTFYYAMSSREPPVVRAPLHENSNHLFLITVESKFGTSTLHGPQILANRFVPNYEVDRWTDPWLSQMGTALGTSVGSAASSQFWNGSK
jgi:prepilin-type N-terminal cleavage/methylation domain-containing protein